MQKIIVFRTGAYGTWREKYGGIASFAKSAGWMLQPVDARATHPDIRELREFWSPAGAIVDASGIPEIADNPGFAGLPVVHMNPEREPSSPLAASVVSDSEEIAKLAMGELLQTNPLSIIYIEWFKPRYWSAVKRESARRIAAMHGIPFAVVTPSPGDTPGNSRLERRIAETLRSASLPCGIFAATDDIGAIALSAATGLGLAIPADAAVVSVDDDPEVCENCTPTLTSVRPDFHRLGFVAASLLRALIEEGPGCATRRAVVKPLRIVRRASTVTTAKRDPKVAEALEFIRLNACDGLRPGGVAGIFGGSRRSAEIRFKKATGHTIGDEILERRFAAACDYLREGRASIAAIADFCGWNGDIPFRKAFKARFGTSPLRWVKAQKRTPNA